MKFNTKLIKVTLPPNEMNFPFQRANLFRNFTRKGSHVKLLLGLQPIRIPRNEKGR